MAGLANAQISIHSRGVTITSGKFRTTLTHHQWWSVDGSSFQQVVHLPEVKKCDRLSVALGLVIRSKRGESDVGIWNEALRVLNSLPKERTTTPSPTQATRVPEVRDPAGLWRAMFSVFGNANPQGWQLFQAAMPILSLVDFQAETPAAILRGVGEQGILTAERFVQRNILQNKISRHIPQDVKIAVAVRDDGRCTSIKTSGTRCLRTNRMHYDHRIIPFHLGGPQEAWNMCLKCDDHNWAKGGKIGWM